MSMDFAAHLGAVSRSVTAELRDDRPARRVTLERGYATSAEDLWDAATNPERLPRWFLPVSGDLRRGGRYQLEGNAGGTITECVPPQRLDATWEFAGGVSWIELRIIPDGDDRARLALAHICPVDAHWQTYGPGAVGVGWDLGLLGLALYLSGDMPERFDEAAFAASAGGRAFITGAAQGWRKAAVASGDPPADAEAASRATAAFYTGEGG